MNRWSKDYETPYAKEQSPPVGCYKNRKHSYDDRDRVHPRSKLDSGRGSFLSHTYILVIKSADSMTISDFRNFRGGEP